MKSKLSRLSQSHLSQSRLSQSRLSQRRLALFFGLSLGTTAIVPAPGANAQGTKTPGAKPAAPAAPVASAKAGPKVLMDINGDKIYVGDVERQIEAFKSSEPSLATGTPTAQKALADIRQSIIDGLIDRILLVQEARRRKIPVKKEDVDKRLKQFREAYYPGVSDEKFAQELAKHDKTSDDLRRSISEELMLEEMGARLLAEISVSNADIMAYYKANPGEFKVPEMVRARQILVAYPENATAEQKKAARAKAEGLLKKAGEKNADFIKLARENSDDLGTKDTGGDMDYIQRGWFLKPFEDAVFQAPLGLLPRLVETEIGLHIVKIEQKEPERLLTFDEIKDIAELRTQLRIEKMDKQRDAQLAELRQKAKITKY